MNDAAGQEASTGVFLDSSALYAVFDGDDAGHPAAAQAWDGLLRSEVPLHTSSYVLVELTALLQRRLGTAAVDALTTHVLPWVNITWADEALHAHAVTGMLVAAQRDLSLVDCASFTCMRRLGLVRVFTLDRHFSERGFTTMPASG